MIFSRKQSVLYNIFDWPSRSHSSDHLDLLIFILLMLFLLIIFIHASTSPYDQYIEWNKVWVKPQGCVVKVFPRGVSKDSQTVP